MSDYLETDAITLHRVPTLDFFEVTFEGRRARIGFADGSPAALRALAEAENRRAIEAGYRARRALALADALEMNR